jgi:LacI family transcriptional regulator
MGKKVTAADVARSAGVSPATVDRVLNGRGSVSVDKERRVVEQAIRLGLDRNIRLRPTRTIRIGVAMAHASNPFYESLRLAFARANRLFFASNIQAVVHFFNILALEEVARTMRQAADDADALIVVAPRHPLIEEVLEKVGRAKPLITLVTDLPRITRHAYVGLDNLSAGRVAGDLMGRLIGRGGGDVVVVSDVQNIIALEERVVGFRAAMAERHRQCRILDVFETGGNRERAGEFMRDMIVQHQRLAGVYAISTGTLAIGQALEATGRQEAITMIAHELTAHRRRMLLGGIIDAVIDQNPELEVLTALEVLAHHFGRLEKPPTRPVTPFTLYFRENC